MKTAQKKLGRSFFSGFSNEGISFFPGISFRSLSFLCLLLSVFFTPSPALNLKMISAKHVIGEESIPDSSLGEIAYVSHKLLEFAFKKEGHYSPLEQIFAIPGPKGDIWKLVVDGSFIATGDEIFNLTYPIFRSASDIYLPIQPLLQVLSTNLHYQIRYDQSAATIVFEIGTGNILSIHHESRENGSLVDIHLLEPLEFQSLWVPPHYILNFKKGRLNRELLTPTQYKGNLVEKISTIQEDSVAQVTLYIPRPVDTVEVISEKGSSSLSLLIRKKVENISDAFKDKSPPDQKAKKTIIIDPGHGGKDPGAQHSRHNEKTITLQIGKKLKKKLEKMGYKVLLTREKDKYLTLAERPQFATKNGGDLFISLHCNAIDGSPKKLETIKGFVAYILRAGESDEDKALARRENQAIKTSTDKSKKTEISAVEWILLEHELNLYSHQSEKLAESIVNHFDGGKIRKHRTGAHQAGFFVLVGTFMPAVLFEMGFITNSQDRKYMASKKGQDDIAQRLSLSIESYFKENSPN